MSLSEEQRAQYVAIIDGILASADLTTVSAKKVRAGIQQQVSHDISSHKDAINALIGERFDVAQARNDSDQHEKSSSDSPPVSAKPAPAPVVKSEYTNGTHTAVPVTNGKRSATAIEDVAPRPAKKPKSIKMELTEEEKDAILAARLQAEENGRARNTRGGGVNPKRKTPLKKEKSKKRMKSKTKIGSDDDSMDGSDSEEKEVNRKGGFHKPFLLSQPLVDLLGETQLSRPQTVKRIWEYIKENGLQNPDDKRQIRCDEPLRRVFKQDTVHMFTMNKILSTNLYAVDETVVAG